MAKILVNYIYNKFTDKYEIQHNSYVFADMKVAVMETEDDIREPLVVPIRNQMTIVDRAKYEELNKKFYLVADQEGNVRESKDGVGIWLPKDTDLSKLRYVNGQLVMVEEAEKEPKKETKPKKASGKKEA